MAIFGLGKKTARTARVEPTLDVTGPAGLAKAYQAGSDVGGFIMDDVAAAIPMLRKTFTELLLKWLVEANGDPDALNCAWESFRAVLGDAPDMVLEQMQMRYPNNWEILGETDHSHAVDDLIRKTVSASLEDLPGILLDRWEKP